jgi:hypothetical protein
MAESVTSERLGFATLDATGNVVVAEALSGTCSSSCTPLDDTEIAGA